MAKAGATDDPDEGKAKPRIKINYDFNFWSIGTTVVTGLVAFAAAWVWIQADVKALQTRDTMIENRIDRLESIMTRRLDAADERDRTNRDAFLRMEGDIRVVRQILESMRVAPYQAAPPR